MLLARHRAAVLVLAATSTACIFSSMRVTTLPRPTTPVYVQTPVKAHLADGSVILYRQGVNVTADSLLGNGVRFDLTLKDSVPLQAHALADVVGMEVFRTDVDGAATFVGSTLGIAVSAAGAALLAIAIFGSCPTVYTDTGAGLSLQAESFSYSIAPLFEMRDVDGIVVRPDSTGRFVVEIRNEALETHNINQLEVLEARHRAGELVMPDAANRLVALSNLAEVVTARDRSGADRRDLLSFADGRAFRTSRTMLDSAAHGELEDWIDVTVARPGADSAALLLRLRNSLLNTVLLYDVLLGGRGAGSLDWLGGDLNHIGEATRLGQWYHTRMGLRVAVREDGRWRGVGRIPDTGPIAWKDVALVVPVPRGEDSLRIRLSFVADNWRIDQARVAGLVRRPAVRALTPTAVAWQDGPPDSTALTAVLSPDDRYLRTLPGQRIGVTWDAGPAPAGDSRTFFLAAQGYYTEWIRAEWLTRDTRVRSGATQDDLLRLALADWRVEQPDFERRFYRSRVEVR
ncbi:MAG: hypothetical protein ACHQU1_02700 [Gemmatimonadales bacterium]